MTEQDLLIRVDCLRDYFRQGITVSVAVLVVTGIVAWRLWDHIQHDHVAGWYGAIVVLQCVRVLLGMAFLRWRPMATRAAPWAWTAAGLSALLALVLGAGGVWLSIDGLFEDEIFMVFVLSAFSAGSLSINAYNPPAMYAFLVLTGPPYTAFLLTKSDTLSVTTGWASMLYVIYLLIIGTQQARTLRESVRLRHENKSLIVELKSQAVALEEAGREKSRFFAAASHDLRQPVHAMGMYVSLLRRRLVDEDTHTIIRRLGECVDSLESLFRAILGVARAEAPAEEMQVMNMPIQRVIDSAVSQQLPLAEAKGLCLRVRRTDTWTRGDPAMLERIVANLLSNAVRHTERGGVLIGVRRRAHALTLQVFDTGVGIAPQHHQRIFDEFYQVDNPKRDPRVGLGLGLAIVLRLCERMRYRLALASTAGRGSVFSVELPRVPASQAGSPAAVDPDTSSTREEAAVLAVDDDASVRAAMATAFAEWGVQSHICASAQEALDAIASHPDRWSRLVLDLRLGTGMNGLELAAMLAERGFRPTRIMLVTAEPDGETLAQARERGFLVLRKPVKMVRLRAFIESHGATNI